MGGGGAGGVCWGAAGIEQSAAGCSFFLLSLTGRSKGSGEVTEPRTNPILGWLTVPRAAQTADSGTCLQQACLIRLVARGIRVVLFFGWNANMALKKENVIFKSNFI